MDFHDFPDFQATAGKIEMYPSKFFASLDRTAEMYWSEYEPRQILQTAERWRLSGTLDRAKQSETQSWYMYDVSTVLPKLW